jgi:tetratricopeptide (TPR) repeat protein
MRPVLFLTLLCALHAWAGVDEDWKDQFSQATRAAALKDFPTAETTYAKALKTAEIFGKDDKRVASTVQNRATLFRAEKKLTEAEDDARRALAIYIVSPGEKSMEFGQTQFILSGILMDEGKFDGALDAIKRALPILEQNLGPNASAVEDATCVLGDAYVQLKRYASAEAPLRRCADMRADDGGVSTAEFGEVAFSLAVVFQRLGNLNDSEKYFTLAEHIREQVLGISSPVFADTLEAHASLLHQLKRDDEAKRNERMAASIRALNKKK